MTKENLIRHIAARASQDSFFLAGALGKYCSRRNVNEAKLASYLCCRSEDIPRIGLCRRPNPNSATFRFDVDRIARSFNLCADRLVIVIRESDVLDSINTVSPTTEVRTTNGLLIAARDVDSDDSNDCTTPRANSDSDEEDP